MPNLIHHDPLRPLVTVQLMTHPGHAQWIKRAVDSLRNQDLPPHLFDLQIVHDGPFTTEEALEANSEEAIEEACHEVPFPVYVFATPDKSGYYTYPRNQAIPHIQGYYIVHMDADNEFLPNHLSGLLEAMRTPDGDSGLPHFAYTRRHYSRAPLCTREDIPYDTDSTKIEWTEFTKKQLCSSPQHNFIDTGDFMTTKSALYYLATKTGTIWNQDARRFGDWDLMARFAMINLRGRALDQVSHIYWWTGENVQLTRAVKDEDKVIALPSDLYERFVAEGKIKPSGVANG